MIEINNEESLEGHKNFMRTKLSINLTVCLHINEHFFNYERFQRTTDNTDRQLLITLTS